MSTLNLKKLAEQSFMTVEANNPSGSVVKLGELERAQLLSYVVDNSIFYSLTNGNDLISKDDLSLKFVKNQASIFSEKNSIGAGTPDKWRITKPIIVEWEAPIKSFEGYLAVEKGATQAIHAGTKTAKMLNQFARAFERTAFKKLENKIVDDNQKLEFDFQTKTSEECFNLLVSKATELTQTIDEKQGLDLIDASDIVILVKPVILDKISAYGIKGNFAEQSFLNGSYAVGTIGGYKIVSCPFLDKFDAIITTNFIAVAATNVIALNAGRIDNLSNDEGVYFEAQMASAIVWDKLAIGISKTAVSSKDNEDKIIELPTSKTTRIQNN